MAEMLIAQSRLTPRLVDSLYVEAMVLADEARAYFEDHGTGERDALPAMSRVGYAVESLKVTTRIMHVIAWLLTRRGVESGQISREAGRRPDNRLGEAGPSDPATLSSLPEGARELIAASEDLYYRVKRIEDDMLAPDEPALSPARTLLGRLERAF